MNNPTHPSSMVSVSKDLLRDMIAYKLHQTSRLPAGTRHILTLSKTSMGPIYADICKYITFFDRRIMALDLIENVYGYTIIQSSVNSNNQTLRITYTLMP